MKLEIDYRKITISPYHRETNSFFSFTTVEVNDLVSLISRMKESCYFISGYRGVGKTSFLRKVEESLSGSKNFVFIHVPIAKYEKYEIVIRNFIRQFYFQCIEDEQRKKEIFSEIKDKDTLIASLSGLYHQTFSLFENEEIDSSETSVEEEVVKKNVKDELLFFVGALLLVSLLTIDFGSDKTYKLISQIISSGIAIAQAIKLGATIKERSLSSKKKSETKKSFYDDEIAEYKFNSLLKQFKREGIKPVFVIDELDKLEPEDAEKVLYLFKSTLLGGDANFIVVGGQELFYKLYLSDENEDHILNTLFSKNLHVSLKSSSELRVMFQNIALEKQDFKNETESKSVYEEFANSIILKSKKIPRKFISLIKHHIEFENEKAFILIDKLKYDQSKSTKILEVIDSISDKIDTHSPVLKDYIVINLISKAQEIVQAIRKEDIDNSIKKSKKESQENKLRRKLSNELKEKFDLLQMELEKKGLVNYQILPVNEVKEEAKNSNIEANLHSANLNSFRSSLYTFRNVAKNIVSAISTNAFVDNNSRDFKIVLLELKKEKIFVPSWLDKQISVNDLVLDDKNLQDEEILDIIFKKFKVNGINLDAEVDVMLKGYANYVLSLELGTGLTRVENVQLDLIYPSKFDSDSVLLFPVELTRSDQPLPLREYIYKSYEILINTDHSLKNKNSYVILLCFGNLSIDQLDVSATKFKLLLKELSIKEDYINRIHFIPVSYFSPGDLKLKIQALKKEIFVKNFEYNFISEDEAEKNDIQLPYRFSTSNKVISVKIKPIDTPFWRFGIVLSDDPDLKPSKLDPDRHQDSETKEIHICVGGRDQNFSWINSNLIELAERKIDPIGGEFRRYNRYESTEVIFNIVIRDKINISVVTASANLGNKTYKRDKKYIYFRAWADSTKFNLNTVFEVRMENI